MRVLVCGFYGHNNFGDDCFDRAFQYIFSKTTIFPTFVELATLDQVDLNPYQAIIVGGGDLINDFYGLKYREVLKNFNGYKIAVGVGISFEDCIKRDYITFFDDIFLRNKKDLSKLNLIIGSQYTHYIPDLAFSLPDLPRESPPQNKNVGFYLVGTMADEPGMLYSIQRSISYVIGLGYNIHLISMYNEEGKVSDQHINDVIVSTFKYHTIVNHPVYDYDQLINVMRDMNFAVCARFHANVFCTKFGIPFISIPITRKVQMFVEELPYNCRFPVTVITDASGNLVSYDVKSFKKCFNGLIENEEAIRKSLIFRSEVNRKAFEDPKFINLLTNSEKRCTKSVHGVLTDPEDVYIKYRNALLLRGVNHLTDNCQEVLSEDTIDRLADMLCYEMTRNPSSEFIYGTRINFRTNIHNLRNMIYYIQASYMGNLRYPKINMSYINQSSFDGIHRAGWHYAIAPLQSLSGDHGVLFDTYLDRTFGWSAKTLLSAGIIPYTNHWVGFFHHTFETEFAFNNCTAVFLNPQFIASLPLCKGIFTLTHYLSGQVKEALVKLGYSDIPVSTLYHPTMFVSKIFDIDKFSDNINRRLINVGSWYRNPISIHRVAMNKKDDFIKFSALKGKKMESNFPPDNFDVVMRDSSLSSDFNIWTKYFIKYINQSPDEYSLEVNKTLTECLEDCVSVNPRNINSHDLIKDFIDLVEVIPTVTDDQFDDLYTENIIFLDLVDASAANTIIECIVRHTPVIVNKIPPVVEALGENYPLYYTDLSEVPDLLTFEKIKECNDYMKTMNLSPYHIDYFVDSLINSDVFRNIPSPSMC